MPTRGKPYPWEIRERAVRMVLEHRQDYESQWEAICSVAEKLGPTVETVRSGCAVPRSTAVCGLG